MKTMSTSVRLFVFLGSFLVLTSLLATGCGSKKEVDTVQAKKTFVGAQSPNDVPEKYRKMERP
jgi:hypothetical protein